MKSFEELECWKSGTEVRRFISELIKKYPADERFGLIDNTRRASRSVTQNIAEGYGRFHFKENIQFCRQSRGSLYEILDQLITARDDRYINESEYEEGRRLVTKSLAILNGYINYLDNAEKKNQEQKKVKSTD